jgi:hypothetical protein
MLCPEFCHATYDDTCDSSVDHTLVSNAALSLTIHSHFFASFDQGLPSVANLPQYFRQNGYSSPDDYEAGPYQFGHETDLESYAYWLTKPEVINNFDTFMNGGKLGNQRRWTGKSLRLLLFKSIAEIPEWFPSYDVIVNGYKDGSEGVMLVDVAGGRGHDIEAFLRKHHNASGRLVLEDLPETIDQIRTLSSKVEPYPHNFFEPQPIEGKRT